MKTQRATGRWMTPLLVVSLALNFLVAGAVGAMVYNHYAARGGLGPPPGAGGAARRMRLSAMGRPGVMLLASWRMLRELPPERRKALRGLVTERRASIREAYEEVARARDELARILSADTLDKAAYEAAIGRLRRADARAREKVVDLADAFIRALTPAERKLYARRMRETAAARKWRRGFRRGR